MDHEPPPETAQRCGDTLGEGRRDALPAIAITTLDLVRKHWPLPAPTN